MSVTNVNVVMNDGDDMMLNETALAEVSKLFQSVQQQEVCLDLSNMSVDYFNTLQAYTTTTTMLPAFLWLLIFTSCYSMIDTKTDLQKKSVNCLFTLLDCFQDNGGFVQLFAKFVKDGSTGDAPILDNVNGWLINKVCGKDQKKNFMRFVDGFQSYYDHSSGPSWNPMLIANTLSSKPGSLTAQAMLSISQSIPGVSLSQLARTGDFQDIMFEQFPVLFKSLASMGRKHGFMHNDLHMDNVLCHATDKSLVVIDYGRVTFDKGTLRYINLDERIGMMSTKLGMGTVPANYEQMLKLNKFCITTDDSKLGVALDLATLCGSTYLLWKMFHHKFKFGTIETDIPILKKENEGWGTWLFKCFSKADKSQVFKQEDANACFHALDKILKIELAAGKQFFFAESIVTIPTSINGVLNAYNEVMTTPMLENNKPMPEFVKCLAEGLMYLALGLMYAGNVPGTQITLAWNAMKGFHTYFQCKMDQKSVNGFLQDLSKIFEKNDNVKAIRAHTVLMSGMSGGDGITFPQGEFNYLGVERQLPKQQQMIVTKELDGVIEANVNKRVSAIASNKKQVANQKYEAIKPVVLADYNTNSSFKLAGLYDTFTANALEVMAGNQDEMKFTGPLEEVSVGERWQGVKDKDAYDFIPPQQGGRRKSRARR